MHIIIVGNSGTGKSTLSKKIARITGYPLMHLDSLWHMTDYSNTAKIWFDRQQKLFMNQVNWIIDGNYARTMNLRIPQADIIIWLKVSRIKSLFRVLKRSLLWRIDKSSRAEMPAQFSEHLDSDYLDFLRTIFAYDDDKIFGLIEKYKKDDAQIFIITNTRAKRHLLKKMSHL
jgi:Adenylate kinase and related kinases